MKLDAYESEILKAFESGQMRSVATKAELAKFREAARATAIKDRRVNIRLSSGDLADIQVLGEYPLPDGEREGALGCHP